MIVRTSLPLETVRGLQTPGRSPRAIGAAVVPCRPGVCEAAGRSRTHATRADVLLVGNGRFRDGLGQYGAIRPRGGYSPQYVEYGDWCAALFSLDPTAVVGPYKGAEAFLRATHYVFPVKGYPTWIVDAMDRRAWLVPVEGGPGAWVDAERGHVCTQTEEGGWVHRVNVEDWPRDRHHFTREVPEYVLNDLTEQATDVAKMLRDLRAAREYAAEHEGARVLKVTPA